MTKLTHGHLVIFVDGYKYHYKGLTHFVEQDGKHYAVPDKLMPAYIEEVGMMDWWVEGWAIGDNPTNRPCSRCGSKPLKKFHDYDEAVRFAYARQQKNKLQQHVLVYVTKDATGREQREVVRSFDEIVAIDQRNDSERKAREEAQAEADARRKARLPELDLLRESFGYMKAWKMADLLAEIREKGRDSVMASMKKSSWYRFKKELKEIGIALPK